MQGKPAGIPSFRRIVTDARLAVSLLRDYRNGSYREVPVHTLVALLLSLLYVFNPLDFLPDVLPIIGLVDDALVMTFCLSFVEKDIRSYGEWKRMTSPPRG
jgi:uncharacterized membrane protein YkvA (DUF1232 family)